MLRHVAKTALLPLKQQKSSVYRASSFFSSSSSSSSSSSQSNHEGDVRAEESSTTPPSESPSPEQQPASNDLIAKLTKENKDLKDTLIRSYAEEENVRRIARRDVETAREYAISSFAKSLLDVADNLERAIQSVPEDNVPAKEDPVIKNLLIGVKMTNTDLLKVFEKFHVKKYGGVGEKFDPTLHDALFQIPDASKEANTIGQVLKSGYKLKDRVIRAAEVGTFVAP